MKIKCLIVDDEPLALDLLERHVELVSDLELLAKCENALEATSILKNEHVDILFLDIQMPVITGIDFIKTLRHRPHIILTTAYKEYAYDAFQLEVVDYLLKPITFDRFLRAVNKVIHSPSIEESHQPAGPGFDEAFMYLNIGRRSVKVILRNILYIESLKDYVRVITNTGQLVAHHRISAVQDRLPDAFFLRVHRSYIVSLRHIDAYSSQGIEINNRLIPVGRNYKDEVMARLNSERL